MAAKYKPVTAREKQRASRFSASKAPSTPPPRQAAKTKAQIGRAPLQPTTRPPPALAAAGAPSKPASSADVKTHGGHGGGKENGSSNFNPDKYKRWKAGQCSKGDLCWFRHGAQDTATEAPSFVLMMHVEEGLSKPPLIRKGAATRSDPAYSECHLCVGPASNDCVPEGAPSECANVRTTEPLASAAVGSGESKSTDSPASPRSPVTVMELSLEPPQFQPDRGLVLDAAPLAFPLEPLRATPCAWAWGGSPYFVFQPSPPPTSSPPQDLPWPWQWFSGGAKAAPPIWELPLVSSMSIPLSLLVTPTDGASAC
ncbi:hypothetical protein EMIHUDRAFT_104930 [Emiliania huxleyi CCMP1516]|uniref:C3H1-type domain-containing protein n=2 Tax=Emiliania huxleyi TaxID=2903 RepID=A0A0D3IIV4_EMIH1|nr:hypothetical protein EMIHUDRAFT_104930 [Emiliania huxleyi CCMP1516]EOD11189.1 hypothetical protein EMIHUDRAFT_104930 [Emiliania huxleyi CCMP1516]|eukprot:XP_005763618.1 hypothetical protein EMIHUDRAFT_104930 [Emiliania huxleyi CCMP1516]